MRKWFLTGLTIAATAMGAILYPGQVLDYVLFSVVFFAILYSGIFLPFEYSHFFIAIAWFIGFWLKLVVHFATGAPYLEPTGSFDGSGGAWDRVLLTASIGGLGYLAGRLILLLPAAGTSLVSPGELELPSWYRQLRTPLWISIGAALIAAVFMNAEMGLVVRGYVPRVQLPWPLGGLFAWTTDIGLALAISVLAAWDRALGAGLIRGFFALCVEGAIFSVVTNSRGIYLFHTLPILVAEGRLPRPLQPQWRRTGILLIVWLAGAVTIPILTTALRGLTTVDETTAPATPARTAADTAAPPTVKLKFATWIDPGSITKYALDGASKLLIDRWTGLEGVMAVESYPERGLPLLKEAAMQRRSFGTVDVFTGKISRFGFTEDQARKFHIAALAGPIAFFYYSGSWLIVFAGMALLAMLMSTLERIWTALVRDPVLIAMSGFYLALIVLQLSTGVAQVVTGPAAVTAFLAFVWWINRSSGASELTKKTPGCSAT